jgi:hypothetical protein
MTRMTPHPKLRAWFIGSVFFLHWCFVLAAHVHPLRPAAPYIFSVFVVVDTCCGYWFVESAVRKKRHEQGAVWHQSWPADFSIGVFILLTVVVLLSHVVGPLWAKP